MPRPARPSRTPESRGWAISTFRAMAKKLRATLRRGSQSRRPWAGLPNWDCSTWKKSRRESWPDMACLGRRPVFRLAEEKVPPAPKNEADGESGQHHHRAPDVGILLEV